MKCPNCTKFVSNKNSHVRSRRFTCHSVSGRANVAATEYFSAVEIETFPDNGYSSTGYSGYDSPTTTTDSSSSSYE